MIQAMSAHFYNAEVVVILKFHGFPRYRRNHRRGINYDNTVADSHKSVLKHFALVGNQRKAVAVVYCKLGGCSRDFYRYCSRKIAFYFGRLNIRKGAFDSGGCFFLLVINILSPIFICDAAITSSLLYISSPVTATLSIRKRL